MKVTIELSREELDRAVELAESTTATRFRDTLGLPRNAMGVAGMKTVIGYLGIEQTLYSRKIPKGFTTRAGKDISVAGNIRVFTKYGKLFIEGDLDMIGVHNAQEVLMDYIARHPKRLAVKLLREFRRKDNSEKLDQVISSLKVLRDIVRRK